MKTVFFGTYPSHSLVQGVYTHIVWSISAKITGWIYLFMFDDILQIFKVNTE